MIRDKVKIKISEIKTGCNIKRTDYKFAQAESEARGNR